MGKFYCSATYVRDDEVPVPNDTALGMGSEAKANIHCNSFVHYAIVMMKSRDVLGTGGCRVRFVDPVQPAAVLSNRHR
jgi:hypothetical protein